MTNDNDDDTSNNKLDNYAKRAMTLLDDIADTQTDLKQLYEEIKNEGYNLPVLKQAIKEIRQGEEYREKQLTKEAELNAYREALGLPVDLAKAQADVREFVKDASRNA